MYEGLMAEIKGAGSLWGEYMREQPNGYPTRSVMARIKEEGPVGAAIKQHVRIVPVNGMSKTVAKFHRGYLRLAEERRALIFLAYVTRMKWDDLATTLDVSKSTMYRMRAEALAEIGKTWETSFPMNREYQASGVL